MRSKLRDLAAAEHGQATARTQAATASVARKAQVLEDTLDEAEDTLTGITSVYELDNVAGLVECQRLAIVDAEKTRVGFVEAEKTTEAQLRSRIRQLKTAERVVEMVKEQRAVREARAEQSANDDLVNARRTK
ncbi:MAG TPA: hypothetical protein VGC41_07710 [Kofleriaceae bacterium]